MFVVILIILLSIYLFLLFQKKKDNFLAFKPLNNNTELEIINSKFINDHLNVTIKEIGNDKKILIIENFFKDPKYHLEYIKNNKNKEVSQHKSNGYPGVRIEGHKQLINEVIGFLSFAGIIYYNKDTSKYSVINSEFLVCDAHAHNTILFMVLCARGANMWGMECVWVAV